MTSGAQISVGDGELLGDWIVDGLNAQVGSVGSVVPALYPAYCRILHPARSEAGGMMTWKQVAEQTGGTIHSLVQWGKLNSGASEASPSEIEPPLRGRFDSSRFAQLCKLLMEHEVAQAEWWHFAFWIGWAWSAPLRPVGPAPGKSRTATGSARLPSIDEDELRRPLLRLAGGRDYRILSAPPLMSTLFDRQDSPWGELSTPNLMWPPDRSWCLGTEIDFDSTIVGGSDLLIGDLLRSPDLEAWKVGPDDCLTSEADQVN
jgi:hypothetical protein